jgi:hypothetical protein
LFLRLFPLAILSGPFFNISPNIGPFGPFGPFEPFFPAFRISHCPFFLFDPFFPLPSIAHFMRALSHGSVGRDCDLGSEKGSRPQK